MTVGARHREDADATGETAAAFPQTPNRSSNPARHFKGRGVFGPGVRSDVFFVKNEQLIPQGEAR